ncbi:MAG: ABC transporter permease subunit [Alphaproteobacteria bacterium]|nr:ABC transporter permease subunit [Alphaproteobacteria bacterium]
MSAWRSWRGPLLMVVGLLVSWQALYAAVGDIALRSPVDTIRYTVTLLGKETFWPHLWESMRAFAVAIVIAVAAGVGIGLALGFGRMAGQVFEPMLVALYSVPKVTLYPILLLTFGLGISAKIAFGALHGFIPIALFTINAVRNVRPILVKTGRVLNYGTGDMVWRILIPAALPEIFSGIRIGVSLTLIGTLLGEMFASQRGLGYMLMNGIGLHNVDVIMAITFILIVFAAAVSSALLAVDRRLHRRV